MSSNKVWKLKPPSPLASQLAYEVGLTPLQAQLLINRGISDKESASSFLSPRLSHMADPMLFKGMDDAVETIVKAIENRKKILIFGDYDADGLTATALLLNFFSNIGFPASFYIPNRLSEGYGPNRRAIERIAKNGTDLIITVDCGISSRNETVLAKNLGMKVVVTDHHQIPKDFQANCPVINPHQQDCLFPFKDLAGVGVAFFLAVAMRAALREKNWFKAGSEPDLRDYLDLVALGTVADRVPLLDQNRILVNSGMRAMARSRWAGIKAMKEIANIDGDEITADDMAYRLAPRLNAPGRIGGPEIGIHVLTEKNPVLARDLALKINSANIQRQGIERDIFNQIEHIIEKTDGIGDQRTLFMTGEGWHKGVLGIVASRLVDKHHRPSLVLNIEDSVAVGSGRSIDGFNLYSALSRFGHLFEKFGGHAHAAGFTLKADNLNALRSELEGLAGKTVSDEELVPSIVVDAEISLQDITPEMVHQIRALSPFGEKNPEPIFLAHSLEVLHSRVVGERHLKLKVRQGEKPFDTIGFGLADRHPLEGKTIDMVFTPELNRWQGHEKIQLKVIDLRD